MVERMKTLRNDESGVALITVVMALLLIGAFTVLVGQLALSQQQQSDFQAREDGTIAGAEAMLERYATKMTLDPLYYLHKVDEAERTRSCNSFPLVVDPGGDWDDTCLDWDYLDTPDNDGDGEPDWYVHPLMETDGDPTVLGSRDVGTLLEIRKPFPPNGPLTVEVVGRMGSRINRRSISATIDSNSLSEFVRVTERALGYGSNAHLTGKVYSLDTINFGSNNTIEANVYAENGILNEPANILNDAQRYDGLSPHEHEDIREEFATPLDFNSFWTDLRILKAAACGGGGICLDDADATAWMLHPYENGAGDPKVAVWKSTLTSGDSCINSEEYWWLYPQGGSEGPHPFNTIWSFQGEFDFPTNGALWANQHVVIGTRSYAPATDVDGDGFKDVVMKGALTVYAGEESTIKNVILNADTTIWNYPDSLFTLGLVASDELIINPRAVGSSDRYLRVQVAMLGQEERWRVSYSCGTSGSRRTPSGSTLDVYGSIATKETGVISGSFTYRNYNFDPRLAFVRPPLYPLINADWFYENWTENPLPDWVD